MKSTIVHSGGDIGERDELWQCYVAKKNLDIQMRENESDGINVCLLTIRVVIIG